MDNPDLVRRVIPPTDTIQATKPATPNSQYAIGFKFSSPGAAWNCSSAGCLSADVDENLAWPLAFNPGGPDKLCNDCLI